MDQQELQQKIAEYFSKLPSEAQESFASMQWLEVLKDIGSRYNLNEEQIESLGTETTLILLGIIHYDEYEQELNSQLKMPKETFEKIIAEINDKILKPIRPELDETFKTNAVDLAEERYGDGQKIDEKFATLPKEVQNAIAESGYQKKLYEIGQKQKLTIEQMGKLDEITTKVMLGTIHPDKYVGELHSALGLAEDKNNELVNDVNEGVLKNIREILKQHWGKEEGEITNYKLPITNDEKIPAPPYATPPVNLPTMPTTPTKQAVAQVAETKTPVTNSYVEKSEGVEIIEETPRVEKPEQDKITMGEDKLLVKSGVSLIEEKLIEEKEHLIPNEETQKSSLYGIEHPVVLGTNIIDQKLRGTTSNQATVSDHSIPANKSSVSNLSSRLPHDPYRETV